MILVIEGVLIVQLLPTCHGGAAAAAERAFDFLVTNVGDEVYGPFSLSKRASKCVRRSI